MKERTPKEQADYLINKFTLDEGNRLYYDKAVSCAIVSVNETIKEINCYHYFTATAKRIKFLKLVLIELNK